jgi:hypothetical protein
LQSRKETSQSVATAASGNGRECRSPPTMRQARSTRVFMARSECRRVPESAPPCQCRDSSVSEGRRIANTARSRTGRIRPCRGDPGGISQKSRKAGRAPGVWTASGSGTGLDHRPAGSVRDFRATLETTTRTLSGRSGMPSDTSGPPAQRHEPGDRQNRNCSRLVFSFGNSGPKGSLT